MTHWRTTLLERLSAGAAQDGAWSYGYRQRGASEPTAWAALALVDRPSLRDRALTWLARIQGANGGVPVGAGVAEPEWPTAPALLAWSRVPERYQAAQARAAQWLLRARGTAIADPDDLFGHDTRLIGWPWALGTHSWVEPTALAVLALRSAGHQDAPRVREGVQLLLDRCLPAGGWNYGNTRVLESTLRPFPATTGAALVALSGEQRTAGIDRSLAYLRSAAPSLRSGMSLGWAGLGLRAWDDPLEPMLPWFERSAEVDGPLGPDPLADALLLLASAPEGTPRPGRFEVDDG